MDFIKKFFFLGKKIGISWKKDKETRRRGKEGEKQNYTYKFPEKNVEGSYYNAYERQNHKREITEK